MKLGEILSGVRLKQPLPAELAEIAIDGLAYDSRKVGPNFLFFAFPGSHADGRQFVQDAVARGAVAVASDSEAPGTGGGSLFTAPCILVEHGRQALALASRNFYHKPDERVNLTAITGTNGKTTSSYLIDSVFRAAGHTTALIGALNTTSPGESFPP